jgi:hypothetical protein
MALALGRSPEEEPKENLHKVAQVFIYSGLFLKTFSFLFKKHIANYRLVFFLETRCIE